MGGGTRSFREFASTMEANARRCFGARGLREFASTMGANSRLFCGARSFREFAPTGEQCRAGELASFDARRFERPPGVSRFHGISLTLRGGLAGRGWVEAKIPVGGG